MTGFSPGTRALVYARAGECCEMCGVYGYAGSLHHRRPRGMGGDKRPETNAPSAALLLCGSGTTGCHGYVESHRDQSYDHGLLLRRHQLPLEQPVLIDRGWVLLDDFGNYLTVAT